MVQLKQSSMLLTKKKKQLQIKQNFIEENIIEGKVNSQNRSRTLKPIGESRRS